APPETASPGSRRARRLAEAAATAAPTPPAPPRVSEPGLPVNLFAPARPATAPASPATANRDPLVSSRPAPHHPAPNHPAPNRPGADRTAPDRPAPGEDAAAAPRTLRRSSPDDERHEDPGNLFGDPGRTPGEAPGDDDVPHLPRPRSRGPLLPLLSLLLLTWSATALGNVNGPQLVAGLLAAAAAASPLAAVFALAVAAFAVRGRRWVVTGVATLAGLLPWAFALPYAVPADATTGSVTAVRVLVVNAHDGQADPGDIAAAVREQKVDLLVVTELTSRLAHDLTDSGLDLTGRWVTVPEPDNPLPVRAGLGIWSRLGMSGFTPVPGTRWPAVRAKVDTGHGTLTVIAGHVVPPGLGTSGTWAADLAALHAAAQVPGPVAVLGGLNGTPWNAQFRAAAGGHLRDAGNVLGHGIRPTWPSWLGIPLLPLDHVLVGGRVGVRAMDGATIDGTDHRGLLVTLAVPDGARP
ncbi:MAG TPA: endonuclease/exonuclease/phosphatase family protein, partial [Kineosporiaceae bacterium]|nr:endonuclease/exonuclease/phosphatase family protein [Kineosporiaceae bacterium]